MIVAGTSHFLILDTRKLNIFARGLFGHYIVICYNLQDILAMEYGGDMEGGGMYRLEIFPSFLQNIDVDNKNRIKMIGVDLV